LTALLLLGLEISSRDSLPLFRKLSSLPGPHPGSILKKGMTNIQKRGFDKRMTIFVEAMMWDIEKS
jgi:hypothetical protein